MYSQVKFAPLGRVAGTDGDDQVAAGNDRPGERGGPVAGGPGPRREE
jgi:hypothetical protein